MPKYEFQLIPPRDGDAFHHSHFEELTEAVKARLPITNIGYEGKVSDEDTRRQSAGLADGRPIPVVVFVTLDIDGEVSREDARAQLQDAVAGLGRRDINVVNA